MVVVVVDEVVSVVDAVVVDDELVSVVDVVIVDEVVDVDDDR